MKRSVPRLSPKPRFLPSHSTNTWNFRRKLYRLWTNHGLWGSVATFFAITVRKTHFSICQRQEHTLTHICDFHTSPRPISGLKAEGIFRVPGSASTIKKISENFDAGTKIGVLSLLLLHVSHLARLSSMCFLTLVLDHPPLDLPFCMIFEPKTTWYRSKSWF